MAKASSKKAPTKSEILNSVAEATELSRKKVTEVLDALTVEVKKSLSKKGSGQFTIPGLCKIYIKRKPAQPAKKGVKNPFTGELQDRPAKPATNVVKVRPLKQLKDMVNG
ncbi:MAG: HU family DNA-binding protein [Pirellulales bacterium]